MITKVNSLKNLINDYGNPDALIDNFSTNDYGYAIWGFSEILEFSNNGLYYNGIQKNNDPFDELQTFCNSLGKSNDLIETIGFISYDIKNYLYPHIDFKKYDGKMPLFWFAKPKKIIKYTLDDYEVDDNTKFLKSNNSHLDLSDYKYAIDQIKDYLYSGNTYQINFTFSKSYTLDTDPLSAYLAIRNKAKPEFGYYINTGLDAILSFSPEQFFYKNINQINTYPMKGTQLRDINSAKDQELKNKLHNSVKDKAEHLMIVDLLRNDIGKICKYGSVNVNDLFNINSYPTVHQMVSHIYGDLNNNINETDIFRALLPGGSITGAPKESSMKIIDLLENYNREIYTGTIGYIDSSGNMNFNIAIRTMSIRNSIGVYPVGGGIVWDSQPNQEWDEAHLKSEILNKFIY